MVMQAMPDFLKDYVTEHPQKLEYTRTLFKRLNNHAYFQDKFVPADMKGETNTDKLTLNLKLRRQQLRLLEDTHKTIASFATGNDDPDNREEFIKSLKRWKDHREGKLYAKPKHSIMCRTLFELSRRTKLLCRVKLISNTEERFKVYTVAHLKDILAVSEENRSIHIWNVVMRKMMQQPPQDDGRVYSREGPGNCLAWSWQTRWFTAT